MAVRLTHRQRPDLQSYTILALGRAFAVTGQAALTLAGRRLTVPDRIPYSYTGYAATLTHGNLEPTWSSTVGTITFTQGTASTHDLTQYTTNFNPTLHFMQYASSVTAPTGVTLVSTGSYSYNGTGVAATSPNVQIEIVDNAASDWVTRRSAFGVTAWKDFSDASSITPYLLDNGGGEVAAGKIAVVPTGGVLGNGCLRITNTVGQTGTAAGYYVMPLNSAWSNNSQSFGSTPFYIFMRLKINAGRLYASSVQGWKWFIAANFNHTSTSHSSSNNSSVVGQDQYFRGFPQAYSHNNSSYTNFEENRSGVGILLQNSIDNGGSPNSSRYCLYPGPYTGCWTWPVDEWISIKARIQVTTYGGTTGNNFDMWVARQNATSWVQTHSFANFLIGNPPGTWSGINGLFLTGYQTAGITDQAVESRMEYDQIIVSTSDIALPAVGA